MYDKFMLQISARKKFDTFSDGVGAWKENIGTSRGVAPVELPAIPADCFV